MAVILGIVGLQVLDDSGDNTSSNATTTSVGTVTTAPGTTVPVRPTNQVRVKVYNASGTQGKAQTLTDELAAKGYVMQDPETLTGSYQGTAVECVKGFEQEAKVMAFLAVPGSTFQPYPSDPPAGASDADCIVIIGS